VADRAVEQYDNRLAARSAASCTRNFSHTPAYGLVYTAHEQQLNTLPPPAAGSLYIALDTSTAGITSVTLTLQLPNGTIVGPGGKFSARAPPWLMSKPACTCGASHIGVQSAPGTRQATGLLVIQHCRLTKAPGVVHRERGIAAPQNAHVPLISEQFVSDVRRPHHALQAATSWFQVPSCLRSPW